MLALTEIFSSYLKALVLIVTGGFLGVSIYGNTLLRQEFDPMWFLPENSYMNQFVKQRETNYPGVGYPAYVVAHNVNWSASFGKFDHFVQDFETSNELYSFENWYEDFKLYSNKNFETGEIGRKNNMIFS